MATKELTPERIRELLDIDYESGICRWKVDKGRGPARVGDVAGHAYKSDGYIRITIDNTKHMAHRLIYMEYHDTQIPEGYLIHHTNEVKTDNRIENLEMIHERLHKGKHSTQEHTSIYPGVCWRYREHKWRAKTGVDGKRYDLGMYADEHEAWNAIITFRAGLIRARELKAQLAQDIVPDISGARLVELLERAQSVLSKY